MLQVLGATKYGVGLSAGTRLLAPVIKRGAVDYAAAADWTPAAGDVRVSKDGGTWADIATLPVESDCGGNGTASLWLFAFSAAELQCKRLYVVISDAATKAVEDQCFVLETFGDASALYPSDPSANNIAQESAFLAASKGIIKGTVGNGVANTTTQICVSGGSGGLVKGSGGALTMTVNDQVKGRVLIFASDTLTAALQGQGGPIFNSTPTYLTLETVNQLTTAPQDGDTFTLT